MDQLRQWQVRGGGFLVSMSQFVFVGVFVMAMCLWSWPFAQTLGKRKGTTGMLVYLYYQT